MALRTKTTKWSWETNVAGLAASTQYDFPAIIVAAELNGRTILSAIIRYSFNVDSATTANITNRQGGVNIDAIGALDVSVAGNIANTGDHYSLMCQEDVTDYFITNFTGASHSVVARWRQVGAAVTNLTAELVLTYQYEDTGLATVYKTVEIPLDSTVTDLTAVLAELGTNQVPLLNDLPEAGKTFHDVYFRIETNAAVTAIGNFQLGLSLDAEAEALTAVFRAELITSYWLKYIWKRTDINPASAHAFNARCTVAGNTYWLKVIMVVTYSYDVASTTRVRNSIRLPLAVKGTVGSGPDNTDLSRFEVPFVIQEPGTITLRQSGFDLYHVATATVGDLQVRAGSQAFRDYTANTFTDIGGMIPLSQRIDSGGVQGTGITLTRGDNVLTVDYYTSTITVLPTAVQGMAYINYDSDVSPLGEGAHNHTIELAMFDNLATAPLIQEATVTPAIPEANYWLNSFGGELWVIASIARGHVLSVAGDSNEALIAASAFVQGADLGMYLLIGDVTEHFDRFPNDHSPGLDVEAARLWKSSHVGSTQHWPCGNVLLTYHALTRTFSGNVTGYTGDGSGITVSLHRVDTGEKLAETTTAVGGSYSLTCYDNVNNLFTQCQQGTAAGRSVEGLAI